MRQIKRVFHYAIILFLICISFSVKGQNSNQFEKMVNDGLLRILEETESYYVKYFKNKRSITEDFYIFVDHYPSNFEFSQEIQSIGVKKISLNDLTSEQKQEGVVGVSFSGIELDSAILKIIFVTLDVKMNGNILEIGLSDGYFFYYEYSCELKTWILFDPATLDDLH